MKNKTLALLKRSLLEPWWIYKKGTVISQKVMELTLVMYLLITLVLMLNQLDIRQESLFKVGLRH